MALSLLRMRQKYASGTSQVRVDANCAGSLSSWTNVVTGLGTTKTTYDVGPINYFDERRRRWRRRQLERVPGRFLPFKVSRVVKGNALYDGTGEIAFTTTYRPNWSAKYSGAILALPPQYPADYPFFLAATEFPDIDFRLGNWCLQQAANAASQPVHAFGVTLGELRETVQMLINPLTALKVFCKKNHVLGGKFSRASVKHGGLLFQPDPRIGNDIRKKFGQLSKTKAGYHVVDESSNFWLTWRFGVAPLIKEVSDILNLDWDYMSDPEVQLSRKRVQTKSEPRRLLNSANLGNYWCINYREDIQYKRITNATASYRVAAGEGLYNTLDTYGLSLRHIPGILWELVPCSFVVDRFVDIGGFIAGLTPDPKVKIIDTCISSMLRAVCTRRIDAWYYRYSAFSGPTTKQTVKPFRFFYDRYSRAVGMSVPILPQLNPSLLNLKQQLDHATLLWQRIPKWR